MFTAVSKLKIKLSKNSFSKNVFIIAGGTASAQIIGMLLTPIISRLYTPEDFGVLASFIAFTGALKFVSSFSYDYAIPVAKGDEEAVNVLVLSSLVLFSVTLITTFFLVFLADRTLTFFSADTISAYWYFIPIGLFFEGLHKVFSQWSYREKNYRIIAKTKYTQALSQNFGKLFMGILGMAPIGLLIGSVLGKSAGVTSLILFFLNNQSKVYKKISIKKIKEVAIKYRNFFFYTTPKKSLSGITKSIPPLLLISMYSVEVAGYFAMAKTVTSIPVALIGTSISNVFYSEVASLRKNNPEKVKALSNKLLKYLFLCGSIPLVAILGWGPSIFSLILGENWYEAGIYASLLSVSVFANLIFAPISKVFEIYEKQIMGLYLSLLNIFLVTIAFGVSILLSLNSYWTIGIYSISITIYYLSLYLVAQKIIEKEH